MESRIGKIMNLQEKENFLNSYRKYNLKIDMKGEIHEYVDKNANPELCTISRGQTFYIPIFI